MKIHRIAFFGLLGLTIACNAHLAEVEDVADDPPPTGEAIDASLPPAADGSVPLDASPGDDAGCDCNGDPPDSGQPCRNDGGVRPDGGAWLDGGGWPVDASVPDGGGWPVDASVPDGGEWPVDASVPDGGEWPVDAGQCPGPGDPPDAAQVSF